MRVLIKTTTNVSWVTEIDVGDGDAARRVWQHIQQGTPIKAGVAQAGGGSSSETWVVLNPAQVVHVSERAD